MNRLTVALAGTAILTGTAILAGTVAVSACAPARSGSRGPAPTGGPPSRPGAAASQTTAPQTTTSPATGPSPGRPVTGTPPAATITIQVWFTRAGRVFPVRRTRPATVATSRLALGELVAGPSAAEAAAGVGSGIPSGTTFEIKGIVAGVATVNVGAAFYGGSRDAVRLRQAQVVYTLTQFPTVSRVGLQSDGAPAAAPVGRADYADLVPAIVVLTPAIRQRVSSPVGVSGTADVFEATVSLRILDAAGNEIATRFTTATCGSGCRGDYSTNIAYRSESDQNGTVEVYEVSARDGSRVNVVDMPVVLAASRA